MANIKQVKCSKCDIPVQRLADPNPENFHACPVCGEGDNLDQIKVEVHEYVSEKMLDRVSAMLKRVSDRNKVLQHREAPRQRKAHRFVVDLDQH